MNRIKTLQELNLLDRFLFSEVMADNEILEDVLEIILGHPVPLKDKAQAEKELRRTPQNKSVYFDEDGEDIRDVAYDMEVQQKKSSNSKQQWTGHCKRQGNCSNHSEDCGNECICTERCNGKELHNDACKNNRLL